MEQTLHFSASTNLKSLLGKGLVTDQITAIFELVKNSYDADSTCVNISFLGNDVVDTIVIRDNGSGMSLDDIEKKWMIVGTDSKKNIDYSPIYNRPLNGDKGIGRFSVDCIGAKLKLKTVSAETHESIEASFDWNAFEQEYAELDSIKIPYIKERSDGKDSGVTLIISDLRETWDESNVKKLIRNLRQFRSPFVVEDNFKIIIDAPQMGYNEYEVEAERLEEISSLWVEVECKPANTDIVYLVVNKDGIEYEETLKNQYDIGPIKGRVYYFNQGDKVRFKNRFSLRVREFGNVRLYRDEFRIHPYGDPDNDWLDIDRRHAQGFSRSFGSRDLIGYIQTYKIENPGLTPLTNRQGFIENDDYKKLKAFIVSYCVATLERYYFSKFKKGKDETIVKTSTEIKAATENIHLIAKKVAKNDEELAKDLKKYVTSIEKQHKEQLKHIKEQEELTKVYSRMAQQETLLHKIIHQSLIDLKDAKTAIEELNITVSYPESSYENELLNTAYQCVKSGMSKMLKIRDDVARVRKKSRLNLKEEVDHTLEAFNPELNKYGIILEKEFDDNTSYYMDKRDLKAIVTNLISNSIKALRESDNDNKKIVVKIIEKQRYYILLVKDNGIGIDELNREKIFNPFFTTTDKYGGFGLGLSIIDDILNEYSSQLELVDDGQPGACFMIKLKR